MSQTSSPGSTPGRRGHKRKRVALAEQVQEFESHSTSGFSAQSSSSGNINIEEIDSDGKFIKLHNASDEVNFVWICCNESILNMPDGKQGPFNVKNKLTVYLLRPVSSYTVDFGHV